MKIAFDGQPLLNGNKSGVGFHEHYLVTMMLKDNPGNQYCINYFSKQPQKIQESFLKQYELLGAKENVSCLLPGKLYRMLSAFLPVPYSCFFGKTDDVSHFFNFCIPPGVKGKKIVTIHDMAFRDCKETVRLKTRLMLKLTIAKSIRRADAIIAVSEFVRQKIEEYYSFSRGKVYVVPNGVDRERFRVLNQEKEKQQLCNVKRKYGIGEQKYFLYLGTIEPRKNLVRLLQAYRVFLDEYSEQQVPVLALAGGKGWLDEKIYQEVQRKCLADKVVFTGYVEDNDVPILLGGAEIFCFPSLYEGFGLPVLEAMACGVPVLTSNTTSLQEIAEGAAVTVNPFDVSEMAEAMRSLFNDIELRKQCIVEGLRRAEEFSWEKSAKKLVGIYKKLVKEEVI